MDDYYWQDQRRHDMRMEQQRMDDLWKTQMLEQQRRDDLWKMQIREDQIQENQRREYDRNNSQAQTQWNYAINKMTNAPNSSVSPESTAKLIVLMWVIFGALGLLMFILYIIFA